MAQSAAETLFIQEMIDAYEVGISLMKDTCNTTVVRSGQTVTWVVGGTNAAEPVTRGLNGLIPSRSPNLTQPSATMEEWHDKQQITDFNEFISQSSIRAKMQRDILKVLNRKVDKVIETALSAATGFANSTAVPATPKLFTDAAAILMGRGVPWNEITAQVTPATWTALINTDQFANGDWVTGRPYESAGAAYVGSQKMYNWGGMNFIVNPNLSNLGTSSEINYIYHRDAVGFANAGIKARVGEIEHEALHYALATDYFAAKLLQDDGVLGIRHDGSGVVAVA